MFEVENEIENQSDVQNEVSSEPQSDTQVEESGQQAAKPEASSQSTELPFHEHPRWKEVMAERNAERQQRQALEQRLAQLEQGKQEVKKPAVDPMYERLKGIDPEFADYMQGLKTRAEKAEALEARLEQFEQVQFANAAKSTFSELNAANKVSPELSKLYEQQLEAAYARGEFKDLSGLKETYQRVHETFSEILKSQERSVLENYTKSKKQDATKPASQPKGKPASSAPSKPMSRSELVQSVLKQTRASSDL